MRNKSPIAITLKQNEMIQKALALHQGGNLDQAEQLYKKLLMSLPAHPVLMANLGAIAFQKGKFEEAVRIISKSLAIAPNQPSALNNRGSALKNMKRLDEAVASYDRAIALNPNFAEAYYNRGNALHDLKRLDEAVASFDRAVAIHPDNAEAYYIRGIALQDLKRLDEAVASYDRAIAINPNHAYAHSNRGFALKDLGRLDEAIASYDWAIAIDPKYADAYSNRGLALKDLGQLDGAIASYDRAIAIDSEHADAHSNRGNALKDLKRLDEAVASYDQAITIDSEHAVAHSNRGIALKDLGRLDEAVASYDRAIAINPNFAEAYSNRGNALKDLGRLDEALASFDRAVSINPTLAEAYFNRGIALKDLGRLDEASGSYDRAIAINPSHADAYWNKSLLKLLDGEYPEGWALYEWGWKNGQRTPSKETHSTLWLGGEPLAGKSLLIYPEQGLGDYIQFIRYAPMVAALGGKVILEVPSTLMAITETLKGQFTLIETGKALPEVDFHCPVMSLPLAFKTTVATIPNQSPYLYADTHKRKAWQQLLGDKDKPRVGLVWSGSTIHKNDHNRSIPLETLKALFGLSVEYHCLQKEIRPDDAAFIAANGRIAVHQELLKDFSDTAALIDEMDLVITVDTSVAHLAGALGKETWILLPYAPDFRWMLGRDDTPWYPAAKLFRQPKMGDWDGVINKIENALKLYR